MLLQGFRKNYLDTVIKAAEKNGINIRGFYDETEKGYKKLYL